MLPLRALLSHLSLHALMPASHRTSFLTSFTSLLKHCLLREAFSDHLLEVTLSLWHISDFWCCIILFSIHNHLTYVCDLYLPTRMLNSIKAEIFACHVHLAQHLIHFKSSRMTGWMKWMHERVRSHSEKEWGINKVKGQGGYLGVQLQQCVKPGGLWALFQRITKAALHRLGRQATKG